MKVWTVVVGISVVLPLFCGLANGLDCWVCTSVLDPSCNSDTFPNRASNTILKSDCQDIPSPSRSGLVPRTIPATTCLKQILKVNDQKIVTRSCASPGDFGIGDARTEGCTKAKLPNEKVSTVTCLCKGDFCNGSESLKMAAVFTLFPLAAILLNRIFSI